MTNDSPSGCSSISGFFECAFMFVPSLPLPFFLSLSLSLSLFLPHRASFVVFWVVKRFVASNPLNALGHEIERATHCSSINALFACTIYR